MESFAEIYKKAIEHKHPNTLPNGGEPEAIYEHMVELVEDANFDFSESEKELEKLESEHKDEIKNLEKDYETLQDEHEKLLKSLTQLKEVLKI